MLKEINTNKRYIIQKTSLTLPFNLRYCSCTWKEHIFSTFFSPIRAKEIETQLLTACKEDLLRIAEYEEAEENREDINTEHQ